MFTKQLKFPLAQYILCLVTAQCRRSSWQYKGSVVEEAMSLCLIYTDYVAQWDEEKTHFHCASDNRHDLNLGCLVAVNGGCHLNVVMSSAGSCGSEARV